MKYNNQTSARKMEHLLLCAEKQVEAKNKRAGFEDITIVHKALPEINMQDIDLSYEFLNKKLNAPFLIASITGGYRDTIHVNTALAKAVEEMGVGIGVGSQRAAIEDSSQEDSFRVVRDYAPNAFIYGNIGAPQIREYGIEGIEKAIEMIDADAIAIHLNFLQEAFQPEGNHNAIGIIEGIKEICTLKIPVIVKETGAGISIEDANILRKIGVDVLDIGGVGGTSWAGVEVYRAEAIGDTILKNQGELFWDFGIPTVASILECSLIGPRIIATGGIRNGLDVAKSIAIGAEVASSALNFVKAALKNEDEVKKEIKKILDELKIAMFLCGCENIEKLQAAPAVVTGWTREYIKERDLTSKKATIIADEVKMELNIKSLFDNKSL